MDPARWLRIEAIFHEVADAPTELDRDAQLAVLCGADTDLAREVGALLAVDASFETDAPRPDRHVGLRLGSYQVDALIARGGMASVYSAYRADDHYHQRVAVKIMDIRLSDPALVDAFRSERQILAALEHTNLTRLIDGGVTQFGEPYLVMEHVDGVSIDRLCDRQRLDIKARVRLFARACSGVAYAHRSLVLHRDLKPSNILVTGDGLPKVVDFGTAALLRPERLTTESVAPLTPAYASPEQLTGKPVGTAADQYSLGLVLFELLAGTPAVPHGTSLIGAVERALNANAPPSLPAAATEDAAVNRGTTLPRLRRQLAGDLATIVTKAIASDPAARYGSLDHFVDDLYRWLRGEVILGRPQSIGYRTSRFAARHRVSVATAALLVVMLIALTLVSVEQARAARRESARAEELNTFLTTMLSSANPSWSNANAATAASVTVRQVLDGASNLLANRSPSDPSIEADMRLVIGSAYTHLSELDRAQEHLEKSAALATAHSDTRALALARSALGTVLTMRGDFSTAEQMHRQVVGFVRAERDTLPTEKRAALLNELAIAILYQRPGDAEGIALLREAIALGDQTGSRLAAIVRQNLAVQLTRNGQIDDAEIAIRESLRLESAMSPRIPEYGSALRTMATLLWVKGQFAEAEPLAREAVEFTIQTRPPNHPMLPNNQAWWGRALVGVGDYPKALDVMEQSVAGYKRLRPAGHQDLALPLIGLGAALRGLGRLAESERALREAELILRNFPALKDRTADMAGELGLTLRAMGRDAAAAALFRQSYETLLALFGPAHPQTVQAKERLGNQVAGDRRRPNLASGAEEDGLVLRRGLRRWVRRARAGGEQGPSARGSAAAGDPVRCG